MKGKSYKSVEKSIVEYVKVNKPVYIGQILKDLKLSQIKGRRKIIGLLKDGILKYSDDTNRVLI
ncbi:MAG: hypothetical protein JEZ14_03360 [Marinilabiliaceae bacterium]|nr:hypothetical protein [Marinilabiliaceae bacterium]